MSDSEFERELREFDRDVLRIIGFIIGVVVIASLASYCTADRTGGPETVPVSWQPHPRVMEATSPLVVYTVERPAPRARVWAIEERAQWFQPDDPVPESAPTVSEPVTAFSVIPEPTPILPPAAERDHMSGLTRDDVRAAARAAGWPASEIETVVRVAECESGLRPWEVGAAGEVGVLQIHPIHRELHARYDLRDPVQNMAAGLEVWQASGWGAWSCH